MFRTLGWKHSEEPFTCIVSQAPLYMGFSRQGYWSGWPFPTPGDLPNSVTEPMSPEGSGGLITCMLFKLIKKKTIGNTKPFSQIFFFLTLEAFMVASAFTIVSVFLGYCNKAPQTWWLKSTEMSSLTALEAGNQKPQTLGGQRSPWRLEGEMPLPLLRAPGAWQHNLKPCPVLHMDLPMAFFSVSLPSTPPPSFLL